MLELAGRIISRSFGGLQGGVKHMPSLFKTREAEAAYFITYDKVLSLWPVEHESIEVSTSLGTTHLNVAGPKAAPPLLLFPGFASNSTMYWPNVEALAHLCRVYAVDTLGQPGRSEPAGTLSTANCNRWIEELIASLDVEQVHLMGVSLGGWLSLNFAIAQPLRTRKVILVDPAATFQPMSRSFVWHSMIPFMIYPSRRGLIRFFRWLTRGYPTNRDYGEMMLQGILNTRPLPPLRPRPFSDSQLSSLPNPVLLLVGEKSVIYRPQEVIKRAQRMIPRVQAGLIPNASHALNMEQADVVNQRVTAFLAEGL
jgi:pimeloyl-ACP methyl ester carboxylesterase